jgi:hypothetical protein
LPGKLVKTSCDRSNNVMPCVSCMLHYIGMKKVELEIELRLLVS